MDYYSKQISKLIEELSSLPGIGSKSAQRLAFHILNMPEERVERLADTILDARRNIRYCKTCYTLTDAEECPICSNSGRDHSTIMVVETPRDLAAYEKTGQYDGVYHVLHGAISPMLGIGPEDIRLKELMQRLQGDVKEVIIATNSSLEGETTGNSIQIRKGNPFLLQCFADHCHTDRFLICECFTLCKIFFVMIYLTVYNHFIAFYHTHFRTG